MSAPEDDFELVEVELLPAQLELVNDIFSAIIVFVAGLGSGKTYGLVHKAAQLAIDNPGVPGLFIEPTNDMIRDVLVEIFDEVLDELDIEYTATTKPYNYVLHLEGGDTEIRLRSGEKPRRIGSGSNLGWVIADEVDQLKPDVVKRIRTRVRSKAAKRHQVVLAGTPEGKLVLYDYAEGNPPMHPETGEPLATVIRAKTTDNFHLPEDYAANAFAGMSEWEIEQFKNGKFVNPGGRAYHAFSDDHVVKCLSPLEGRLVMCVDFNVDPMVWTFGNIDPKTGVLHIWRELWVQNTNTKRQANEAAQIWAQLLSDYRGHPVDPFEAAEEIEVFPDASGKARRSSSSETDIQLLRSAGFTDIKMPTHNPRIKNRVWSANLRLELFKLLFDPAVPQTIRCFANQGLDKNAEPDKTQDLDHAPDGIGYCTAYLWPSQYPAGNNTSHVTGYSGSTYSG